MTLAEIQALRDFPYAFSCPRLHGCYYVWRSLTELEFHDPAELTADWLQIGFYLDNLTTNYDDWFLLPGFW